MDTFVRTIDGKRRTCHVYTEEEARSAGLVPVPWREAHPGMWALTDDGFVGECLRRQEYVDRNTGSPRLFLTFTFARIWASPGARLSYADRRDKGGFYLQKAESWLDAELRRGRSRRVIRLAAAMLAAGQELDLERLGRAYRPDQRRPDLTVRRLLRQEKTQLMIQETLRKILADKGMTEREVIDMYLDTYGVAKEAGHTGTMKNVVDVFRDMFGMYPEEETLSEEEELDFSHEFLAEGKAGELLPESLMGHQRKRLTATRRRALSRATASAASALADEASAED